jgi:hypothetical protein
MISVNPRTQSPAEGQAAPAATSSPLKNLVIKHLVKIKPNTTSTTTGSKPANNKGNKMMLKSYGVPLLPKPPSMVMVVGGQGGGGGPSAAATAASCLCNMKALVACQSCGAYCHDDCISANRLCFTCLIR